MAVRNSSRAKRIKKVEHQTVQETIENYPRDLKGYGENTPAGTWPGGARIALQFVVNYEEGGENCILHGDESSEAFLSEIVGAQSYVGVRHMNMESIYEYGSRAGYWRLLRMFSQHNFPVTVFGVAMALQRNPDVVESMLKAEWEIASHGYRWIDYQFIDCLLYTSPSPRDRQKSRMPSSA